MHAPHAQILDRAKLWKEGMMDQIKREITIMKDLRALPAPLCALSALNCPQAFPTGSCGLGSALGVGVSMAAWRRPPARFGPEGGDV